MFSDPATWTSEQIERARARLLHDVDPAVVETSSKARREWQDRLGRPKRCETNECCPIDGMCLFCCADQGVSCRAQ